MDLGKTTRRRVRVPAQRPGWTEPGGLLLEGALDEVPVDAARRATDVARALLDHAASQHASQRPMLRVARLGSLLNVWLTVPMCSTRCREGSPQMCCVAGDTERGDERVFSTDLSDGGVRLHWVLMLPTAPRVGPRDLVQRRADVPGPTEPAGCIARPLREES